MVLMTILSDYISGLLSFILSLNICIIFVLLHYAYMLFYPKLEDDDEDDM